ncbi:MAG: DUF5685 family protein [Clostridia bacterium]
MFGYVSVNKEALSEEEVKRFSAFYCGLCHALGNRYGTTGRLTLSFDMTFLAMLLSSLYEPDTASGSGRCIVHPNKRHVYLENPMIDYAADMTIALAYHKALDNWSDDKNLIGRSQARMLHARYRHIETLYPRQLGAIAQALHELHTLEKAGCSTIDPPTNAFGQMLGELFVYRKDLWSDTLRTMGAALGRFIYLMDAYDDLPADKKKNRYNPLSVISERADYEARAQAYLTLLLGEGAVAFEKLPLVNDLGILRNILYSGVWTKYLAIQRKREADGKEEKA